MKTELLNQFIFADLLEKHAQKHRKQRLIDDPDSSQYLMDSDFKEGFENLKFYREQSLFLTENSELIKDD